MYARGALRRGFAADAEASEDKKDDDAREPCPRMVRLADDICGLTLLEVHDLTEILKKRLGLAAMPMDLLVGFTKRPQPIDVQEYAKQKLLLNERAQKLLLIAGQLGDDASRARDRKTQKLCAAPRNSAAQFGRAILRKSGTIL